MAAIWEIIKLLPSLFSMFKSIVSLIRDFQEKQDQERRQEQQKAIDKLKEAKTPEEVWRANEDITRNLP